MLMMMRMMMMMIVNVVLTNEAAAVHWSMCSDGLQADWSGVSRGHRNMRPRWGHEELHSAAWITALLSAGQCVCVLPEQMCALLEAVHCKTSTSLTMELMCPAHHLHHCLEHTYVGKKPFGKIKYNYVFSINSDEKYSNHSLPWTITRDWMNTNTWDLCETN